MDTQINIAFIIGCARSGTSILGELIAAHPEVRYIFEAHEIWEQAGPGENDSHRLTAEHATPEVRKRIRAWFQAQQGTASLIVEKCPRNVLRVPFLREVFPEAKILHIVRDGRDVACSLLPGIGGEGWHHLKPPSWRQLFSEHQGIMRCALAWKQIMEIALDDLTGVPHLQVQFEHLVAQPEEVAREVLQHLRLTDVPEVYRFCEKIQNQTAHSYHAQHQTMWYRNDHSRRVGRWRENLDEERQNVVQALLESTLVRLGYLRPCSAPRRE